MTRSLRCDFSGGSSRIWGEAIRLNNVPLTLIFDSIDPAQGRVRLVARSVNTTTVFESAADMKAVHSGPSGTPEYIISRTKPAELQLAYSV